MSIGRQNWIWVSERDAMTFAWQCLVSPFTCHYVRTVTHSRKQNAPNVITEGIYYCISYVTLLCVKTFW